MNSTIGGPHNNPVEVFFGQHGEDYLLWKFFRGKPQGFFVEVGALDGVRFSNTFTFERQGWKGICLEPHPDYYHKLTQNRPGSICVQAAAGREETQLPFFAEPRGEFSTLVRENTINENLSKKMSGFLEILVKVLPLDKVLSECSAPGMIDFVSIDVEGAEPDVLAGFSLKRFSPTCLIIEANGEVMNKTIDAIMRANGYHKAGRLSKTNNFYCKSLINSISLALIPIHCDVHISQPNERPLEQSDGLSQILRIDQPCMLVQFGKRAINRLVKKIKSFLD